MKDVSNTDLYDRLLRYVYVGDLFVNAEIVRNGFEGDFGSFFLDDGKSKVFAKLDAGDYVVIETNSADWYLIRVECDSENVSTIGDSVTIHLEAGEDIKCTFFNHLLSERVNLPLILNP